MNAASDPIGRVFQLLREGRPADAEAAARAAVAASGGRSAPAHAVLGRVLLLGGRIDEAREALGQALRLDPEDRIALLEDALLARREGRPERAESNFRRLVARHPDQPVFLAAFAQLLVDLGRPAEAIALADRALAIDPRHAEAQMVLADAAHAKGEHAAALARWRALAAAMPGNVRCRIGVARAADRLGDRAAALQAWRAVLEADPRHPDALRALIRDRLAAGDRAGTIELADRLLAAHPRALDAYYSRGIAHLQAREPVAAGAAFRELARRDPNHLPARWAGANLPAHAVFPDQAAVDDYVAGCLRVLDEFEALGDPPPPQRLLLRAALTLGTNFDLHYHVEDSRDVQRRTGALVARHARALEGQPTIARVARERPRVLVVSSLLREHSVGRLFERVVTGLDRGALEVHVLSAGDRRDGLTARVESAVEHFTHDERGIDAWRAHVLEVAPDVLLYLDLGMEPLLTWLAAQRLAPVQCTLWGHPVTSGLDSIDWFLTADLMEREGGEADYTERVFRLPGLGCRFAPLDADAAALRGARAAGAPRLGMPQSAYKVTPRLDPLLARIAAALPGATLEFAPGLDDAGREALRARLARAFADAGADPARQLVMVAPMEPRDWLTHFAGLDLNLDAIGWSGGVTSLELFWVGVPTLTLPRRSMRSRHTLGMLKRLELDHVLVAHDPDDYVRRAVDLARSPDQLAELSARILERRDRLYDDPAVSRALQDFLRAVAAGRDPRPAA
jgi:predicted O-linked N-acetylglucosamine transferase (SPINDLY family)